MLSTSFSSITNERTVGLISKLPTKLWPDDLPEMTELLGSEARREEGRKKEVKHKRSVGWYDTVKGTSDIMHLSKPIECTEQRVKQCKL